MSFDPYLHFPGTCRQAMQAYQQVFGGELQISGYADAPDAPPGAAGSDLVMHSALTLGGRMLLASDYPPGMPPQAQQSVSISHVAASVADGKRIYDLLLQGGNIVMPYDKTFWSDGFGMLRDRFGTHWMVSAPWHQPG